MRFVALAASLLALMGMAQAQQRWIFEVQGVVTNSSGFSNTLIQQGEMISYYFEIDITQQPVAIPAFIAASSPTLPTGILFFPVVSAEMDVPGSPPLVPNNSIHYVADEGRVPGIIPNIDLAGVASNFSNGEAGSFEIYVSAASFESSFITETNARTMLVSQQKMEPSGVLPFIDVSASPGSSTVFGDCTGIQTPGGLLPCDVQFEPLSFSASPN